MLLTPHQQQLISAIEAEYTSIIAAITGKSVIVKFVIDEDLDKMAIEKSIRHYVCQHFGVSWAQIEGKYRDRVITTARHVYCWLCRKNLSMTFKAIGQKIGKHHTTVIAGIACIDDYLEVKDEIVENSINTLTQLITLK
jgi:chromosomal replication initiator protein